MRRNPQKSWKNAQIGGAGIIGYRAVKHFEFII
jgi:hypothetical protein